MNLDEIKKVHFVGIGGIGVSAIAKMMFLLGKKVSGSDLTVSEITDELKNKGIKTFIGHQKENLEKDVDLLIYSPAVPENNSERQAAKDQKIQELSYPEFLGELSKNYFTIAVSGTNGKTTTTAMLGLILEKAGLDPTVIVGSEVKDFPNGNFRLGKSKYLVVEGCEWNAHMLKLWPQMIVLTNLEEDHLDYYKDINDIIFYFQKYVDKLPKDGKLILNNDDVNLTKKLFSKNEILTYGIKNSAQIMAERIEAGNELQSFNLTHDSQFLIHSSLHVPGLFNIYNALAAVTVAIQLGVKPEVIKNALEEYHGVWRRFDIFKTQINADQDADQRRLKTQIDADLKSGLTQMENKISTDISDNQRKNPQQSAFVDISENPRNNQRKSAIIVSDYAHHPTAIQGTIKAVKEFYPNKRLFVVFQPHHHNRTKTLFNDFVKSFDQADLGIISEIYGVAGRELKADEKVSSEDLVSEIAIRTNKKIIYAKDLAETKKLILENIQDNDVLLIIGAGDIYKVVEELK